MSERRSGPRALVRTGYCRTTARGTFAIIPVTALLALAGCGDETVARYAGEGPWRLDTLDGAPFPASATLAFPSPGQVAGEAPCNSYAARQVVPYPWFELESLSVTERACPDLAAERTYLAALQEMTLAEGSGGTLLLTNEEGREMQFRLASAP